MLPRYGSFPRQHQHSSAHQQSQSQLGMNNNNPQIPIPFNGMNIPNQPGFVNGPPNNHHPGMPQMGPIPQLSNTHMGFSSQTMNHPVRGPQFAQFNPNMNQFAQFCMPNPLLNMNPFGQMQMPNLSPYPGGFVANAQFGNLHYNPMGQQLNQNPRNLSVPVAAQQVQGNPAMDVPASVQADQTNNNGFARNSNRPDGFNGSHGKWKNPSSKNFNKNSNRGTPNGRFPKSKFDHMKNGRKNFGSPNEHNGRENFDGVNPLNKAREQNQRKSLSLTYTEHEIRQWREERKNNYPSKGNIEKKLTEKMQNEESLRKESEIRRKRLKEILAKQAELGVEVAEIPNSYLSDFMKQGPERRENKRPNRRGRFQNKFDKRRRFDKQDQCSKKQRPNEEDTSSNHTPVVRKKQPTLLETLLSADLKRDKSHLLQVFRFMVANSFFNNSIEDGVLKFPSVIVKDGSGENSVAEEKDVSKVSDKTHIGKVDNDDNGDSDSDSDSGNENDDENKCDTQVDDEEGEIH